MYNYNCIMALMPDVQEVMKNEKSLQKDGTQSENKYSVSDNFCCFNFITCSMHMELCMEYAADDFNYDTLIMYIAR